MHQIDAEFLSRLLDEHAAALELYAAQWSAVPEDIVQEAFVELVRQEEPPQRVVPWLFRVVRNRAVSETRSAHRRRRHERAAAELMSTWFSVDNGRSLDAETATHVLKSLPVEQREVIVARIWGGLTFEEIAEVMETSSSTAHRWYEAGLETLRDKLGVSWTTND